LWRHNFSCENFAQENGQKSTEHAHKVGKNKQQVKENDKKL
jgi:hypothetical protein